MKVLTIGGAARALLASLALATLVAGCTSRIPSGGCEFDSDCSSGQVCSARVCRAACRTNSDCGPAARCVASDRADAMVCVANPEDMPACGRDSDCRDGQTCVEGRCMPQCRVDYDCQVVNPRSRCDAGRCIPTCATSRADCDGVAANGCEVDLRTDARNCGSCARACPAMANGTPVCRGMTCAVTCAEAFGDCDARPTNGCEAPLMTDRANCGVCGRACPAGQVCTGGRCDTTCRAPEALCNGSCTNTQTDLAHCGACDNACPTPARATATCVAGRCGLTCNAGFADCDNNAANGCEVDLSQADNCGMCGRRCGGSTPRCTASDGGWTCTAEPCAGTLCGGACVNTQTDLAHCGACGNRCPTGPGAEAGCEAGRCTLRCTDPTRADNCDGMAANGCESNPVTDVSHCGACGRACPAAPNATPACADRMCGLTCNAGFGNCDGVATNGCEADTRAEVSHCGRCGNACPAPANARPTCAMGACGFTCNAGFADCDGNAANGCEVTLATDGRHCGVCNRACAAMQVCAAGACGTVCPTGTTNCSGSCVNLATSVAHCNACGRACASPPNATATCAMGACGFTCSAGFGDCDGNAANGCETSLLTTATSCGRCGNACAVPNAAPGCDNGRCVIGSCNAGFVDCDGNPANGCEVDTRSDRANCGGCGRTCALPNATTACASGACAIAACSAGFADCDRNPSNGCEVDTRANPAHCGGCGMACNATGGTASCAAGVCGITCAAGRGNCNGSAADGCEAVLASDPRHCGMCGRACALPNATAACAAGACAVASCSAGFGNCDGNAANGCETGLGTSLAHCGACGRACAPPNAAGACTGGVCGIGMCNAGFADCDRNPANGCEVDLRTNPAHCGGCGMACNATGGAASCAAGVCGITCAAGRGNCNGSVADGCEVDTNAAAAHCGACGRVCAPANATGACAGGACGVGACNAGFGNCDGVAANGCEVAFASDPRHCGRCGAVCPSGQVCAMGVCTLTCPSGQTNCGGQCVSLSTDPRNCNGCGRVCPTPPNATATCGEGCGYTCTAGFGDCDGNTANGCEVNLQSTPSSCGACGRACVVPNAAAACVSGNCAVGACNAGFADCDRAVGNGCEVNTQSDLAHCGGCGRACAPANAVGVCNAGACGVARCNAGFADCNGNPADGCEVNLLADPANCGQCRLACNLPNASATCAMGTCAVSACNAGWGNCDGNPSNGCETDTNATVAHCGGCGRACSANNGAPSCAAGACSIVCTRAGVFDGFFYYTALWGNCDGDARTNGCETNLLSPTNCQACGRVCGFPNATAGCASNSGTQCFLASCNAGFADCNMSSSDGCETNTTSDSRNCGACGATCDLQTARNNYLHTCRTSACRPSNDACAAATPINLSAGREIWIDALTANATRDLTLPCQGNTGADIFYSFTLTQREVVYADTMGDGGTHPAAAWDTVLALGSSCAAALTAPPAGQVYCSDDVSAQGCANDGTRSQVYAVLEPGTYYLTLAGYAGNSGRAWIRFQHLPVGGAAVAISNPMDSARYTGTTSGASQISGSCGGNGPEVSYWWRTCSTDNSRYNLFASTCDAGTGYDTVVYIRQGDAAGDVCNDDIGANCSVRTTASTVSTRLQYGAGLHVVTVDSFSGGGAYAVTISRLVIIASYDPSRRPCPPRRAAPPTPRLRAALPPSRPSL